MPNWGPKNQKETDELQETIRRLADTTARVEEARIQKYIDDLARRIVYYQLHPEKVVL